MIPCLYRNRCVGRHFFLMEIARNRIVNFESEYKLSITKLQSHEKEMNEISQLRSKWLENEENFLELETELYQKKIQILEEEFQIFQAKSLLNQYKLEEYYEGLQLQSLIQSTKQLHEKEMRLKNEIFKNNLEEILQKSILLRQNLNNECKNLQNKLQQLVMEQQSSEQLKKSLHEKLLSDFNLNLSHLIHQLKMNLSKIIEDSLILRHNCRIASSLLTEHHQCHLTRLANIKESIRSFNQYSQETLHSYESSLQQELEISLQTKRKQLMKYEQTLDDITLSDEAERLRRSHMISTSTKEINRYKKKYQLLQSKRYEEIEKRQKTLSEMRREISIAQSILLNPPHTYPLPPSLPFSPQKMKSSSPRRSQSSPKYKLNLHQIAQPDHEILEDNDARAALEKLRVRLNSLKEYEKTLF
jgi:hypothetical protein